VATDLADQGLPTLTETAALSSARDVRNPRLALCVVGVAQLLVVVDTTIINIALPSAQSALGMSESAAQWTVTAYALTFGGLLMLSGRLADKWGRKNVLIAAAIGFAVASGVGGAAANAATLIAARAGQGVFAALLTPTTLSILAVTFTKPEERARAFSVVSAIAMSGTAVGLLAGGALAQFLSWRWCLFVNLPPAIATVVVGWYALPDVPRYRETAVDWVGAVMGGGGVAGLTYALSAAGAEQRIWVIAAGAVLLAGFAIRQKLIPQPLLPPSIVADRTRRAACLSIIATGFGMFGMFLFLTYQLQTIMHFGALATGLAFLPFVAGNVIAATRLTSLLRPRVGARSLLAGGMLVLAAGLALLTQLNQDTSYWRLILPAEVVLGIGAGFAVPTAINCATAAVRSRYSGIAAALVMTSQQVGASLGTASLNAVAIGAAGSTAAMSVPAAAAHGYAVASGWAAGVLTAAAVGVALLADRDHRNPTDPALPR
jgi:EmrB/QacA subfamily drug resistance transporter